MRALRSQLATVPGITKEAATAMVKELRDSYKAAEKSARDFAGNTENNMKRVTASTGAARAGVANLGNQFADIAIQLESGTPIGRVMLQQGAQVADALSMMGIGFGTLLRVVAPVGLAVGALALAWDHYSDAQAKAEAGMAAAAGEATALSAALTAVETTQGRLTDELALEEGTVTKAQLAQRDAAAAIVEQYAPLIAAREEAIAGLRREVEAAKAAEEAANARGAIKAAQGQAEARALLTGQIARESVELDNLRRGQDRAITTAVLTIDEIERERKARKALEEAALREAAALAERQRLADADLRTLQARAALDAQREGMVAELVSIEAQATAARLDDAGKVNAALEEQLKKIGALTAEAVKLARPGEAPYIEAVGLKAEVAAVAAANDEIRAIREREDRLREAEAQREIERQRAIQRATIAAVSSGLATLEEGFADLAENRAATVATLEDQLTRSEEYLTDDQRAELEARLELQKGAAARAFEVAKAFKIAQAMVATYTAANEALASAPYPINLANAAVVVTAGLINVGTIAKQNPTFHRGGMVDEMPATVLRGEAVLSRQGRAVLGDETVNLANAGASRGGGSSTTIYQVYDGRILDRVMADTIRRGGRVDGYVRSQRSAPYGHRS
jgi:hypothetical protein